jgi:hypothetical protein
VAVRTTNLALRNLSFDHLPGVFAEHRPYVSELFSPDVVEFKTHDICFAAIDAGAFFQVSENESLMLNHHHGVPLPCLLQIIRMV